MADPISDVMSEIFGLLEEIEDIGPIAQIGLSLGLTLFALLFTRYFLIRMAWRVVKRTQVEWDNEILDPIANRLYIFILLAGVELSMMWTLGRNDEVYSAVAPYFSGIYIILSASIISIAIKFIVPSAMEKYNSNKSVTVTGGNPLLVFSSRGIVWFMGLYLALNEVGIELLGLLASLAVFSLIIGLAVQQTLGNMINSFMLAVDQPFEVGDRIEVEGVTGTVMSVGILSTKILTLTEQLVVIPNNRLVDSTITNFARGGGDGTASRVTLTLDIGVDYDERSSHVKQVILEVAKKCPHIEEEPGPRVLLRELADFSKNYRLYVWISDYSEEFIATDWLLREVDSAFNREGISIPYPVGVELQQKPSPFPEGEAGDRMRRLKATRQHVSRIKMLRDEAEMEEERDSARDELELLQARLDEGDLKKAEREILENDIRALESLLAQFSE
ncbi:MAG: mechanosensitive ion channel domain-containing protein [Candidatus Thermoplasmatota archaeon]|nr:mechanosensitive ion channel domain-containing protein [Candidatus Thermoplasmatota archaeon]